MSIQELLTYVEELSFKTSMIGYDKDEVDIQLDKICDEIEAIVKEKDDEIAALRSGEKIAPVVVDLNSPEDTEETGSDSDSLPDTDPAETEDAAVESQDAADRTEDAGQVEDLVDQITDLKHQLAAAQEKCIQAEGRAEEAQFRAKEAENQAEAAEARLSILEEELRVAKAELEESREDNKTIEAQPVAVAEAVQPEAVPANTTDEAYQLYMKNADLLCRQLAAVDSQKEAIVAEANQEAEKILEAARVKADESIEAAEEEARKITEEGQRRMQQDKEDYQDLLDKKTELVSFMKNISQDISRLIDKAGD